MTPTPTSGDNGELRSWKEIAAHLGVNQRTAQLWAAGRGLPVGRLAGRALARVSDLDEWKARQASQPSPSRRSLWWFIAAGAVTLVSSLALVLHRPSPAPAAHRFDQQMLVITDRGGRELWRWHMPGGIYSALYADPQTHTWFGDLDGDGSPEVLFAYEPARDWQSTGATLICFSAQGKERWRFTPGRSLGPPELDPPAFMISGLHVLNPGTKAAAILVTSIHIPYYPSQVAVLDPLGRLRSEYWHSGHFDLTRLADLDGDGKPEILLGGVSNSYRQATLVVLDSNAVSGASEEPGRLQLRGFQPARERARILFPRSCLNRKLEEYNWIQAISVTEGRIRVAVQECKESEGCGSWYHLDSSLGLVDVTPADAYVSAHRSLFARRVVDHPWSESEVREFNAIRFLRGARVTSGVGR